MSAVSLKEIEEAIKRANNTTSKEINKMFKFLQILYCKIKTKLNKDTTILAVDLASKSTMTFKNGNIIETIPINDSDIIRGKRRELPLYYDNFYFNEEEFNYVTKSFINQQK